MNTVLVSIGKDQYRLAYTVGAMLTLQDEIGDGSAVLDAVSESDARAVMQICRVAAVLIEQGELVRRYMGYTPEPKPLLDASGIAACVTNMEFVELRQAIQIALYRGLRRMISPDEPEEIDLGLAELNAEKNSRTELAHFLRMGAAGGLTKKETLLSFPGELCDLWELHLRASGARKRNSIEDE